MQIKATMVRFEGFLHKLLLISFLWALSNDVPLKIVENGCETFLVTDNQTVDQCIPKKNKKKNRRAPWISEDIIKIARKKKRLYKKTKARDGANLWSKYKSTNNMLKRKCNEAR